MAVRSKRLFGPLALGTGVTGIYQCPAGETAIIKHISLVNPAALATTVTLYLGGSASTNRMWLEPIAGTAGLQFVDLFIVLADGETLRGQTGNSGTLITAYGAELEGVAD